MHGSKERMSEEDETKYLLTTHFSPLLSACLLLSIYSIQPKKAIYSSISVLLLTQAIAEGDGGRAFLCCLNLRTALKMTPAWLK